MPAQKLSDTRLVVCIRPGTLTQLDLLARRRETTRSQVVRDLLRKSVAAELTQSTPPAA